MMIKKGAGDAGQNVPVFSFLRKESEQRMYGPKGTKFSYALNSPVPDQNVPVFLLNKKECADFLLKKKECAVF